LIGTTKYNIKTENTNIIKDPKTNQKETLNNKIDLINNSKHKKSKDQKRCKKYAYTNLKENTDPKI
jgi:hypothetical protein